MKRDLNRMAGKQYDLVVIGGGIFGACVAYDAALRGLSVALVEKNDFGSATSFASMRVIHGGLRYLQSGNIPLMINMKKEQRYWLQIAPHLIRTMPCLISTYDSIAKSKLAYRAALLVNNSANWLVNKRLRADKRLPYGRLLSKEECLERLPAIEQQSLTGAAVWDEAYMDSSERLVLAFILSAARAGADVANYAEVIGFRKEGDRVSGVKVMDRLTGETVEIQSRLVVNSAGAWVDPLLDMAGRKFGEPKFRLSVAFNIVVRKIFDGYLAGFPGRPQREGGDRRGFGPILFAAPWQDYTLIGTRHLPYTGSPDAVPVQEGDIQEFLDEINTACPGLHLQMDDVCSVVYGYLPMLPPEGDSRSVKLVRDIQIFDHEQEGVGGLMTVIGVRYTLARFIAQKAVNLALHKLGMEGRACRTGSLPLEGADFPSLAGLHAEAEESRPGFMPEAVMKHLVETYGSTYKQILAYLQENPAWAEPLIPGQPVIKAQVVHAARSEMAVKVVDVLQRRTGLYPIGNPPASAVETCAQVMADALGWSEQERLAAIAEAASVPVSAALNR